MASWTAASLSKDSQWRVVGFDIRHPRLTSQQIERVTSCGLAKDSTSLKGYPATIDCNVWPQVEESGPILMRNGFNLLDGLRLEVAFGNEATFLPVAFQLPSSLIDPIADMFGIVGPSKDFCLDERWALAGYDVVDIRTQSSVLHSAEFLPTADGLANGCLASLLNQLGVMADQKTAIDIAVKADFMFPEHAPFAPCAVWIFKD